MEKKGNRKNWKNSSFGTYQKWKIRKSKEGKTIVLRRPRMY